MFGAFLKAPANPITLSCLGLFLALTWIVLLRFFATPIVLCTEAIKVAFFLHLAITNFQQGLVGAGTITILCALAVIGWCIYTRKQLVFANKMLSCAAQVFKEKIEMLFTFLLILALYAVNAYLFVTFYVKSFEVVEVQEWQTPLVTSSAYWSPSYTTGMVICISLAYLWSVLLFSIRPENPPGIGRAVWNACTTSMGTLSVTSYRFERLGRRRRRRVPSISSHWIGTCGIAQDRHRLPYVMAHKF